jgi:hypothetical protein
MTSPYDRNLVKVDSYSLYIFSADNKPISKAKKYRPFRQITFIGEPNIVHNDPIIS